MTGAAKAQSVRIGAGSATLVESQIAVSQLLEDGGELDFLVFDCLSEAVMGLLGRQVASAQPGFVADWIDVQVGPFLGQIAQRGIRLISNAGGLDPAAAAKALRRVADEQGLSLRIAWVEGDNISDRIGELVTADTQDMFDGRALAAHVLGADQVLSMCVYTGAFAIAAALDAGADVVITGRAVDSATTLGALIHSFGWTTSDYDRLACGTLAGHLIECSTQVTGGTFTDWDSVPDWANIGFPIAECYDDGRVVLTKSANSGGLLSRGTVAEQLLYEVSDPQHYIVPDVVCDFTGVEIEALADGRVAIGGARGLGRPRHLKASLTWDRGWRGTLAYPVIGLQARAKAERTATESFRRLETILARHNMPPFEATHRDVIGGDGEGASTAICRVVADHVSPLGAQIFVREQVAILTSMAVGISAPFGTSIRPVTHIASLSLPRETVTRTVWLDGRRLEFAEVIDGEEWQAEPPLPPEAPAFDGELEYVPLIALAWARSGDKGDLFNVGVIAREPAFLPYIYHALDPDTVGKRYERALGLDSQPRVDRFSVPGFAALNLIVHGSLAGGMMASPQLDTAAKGMAQLLLDMPIAVPCAVMAGNDPTKKG